MAWVKEDDRPANKIHHRPSHEVSQCSQRIQLKMGTGALGRMYTTALSMVLGLVFFVLLNGAVPAQGAGMLAHTYAGVKSTLFYTAVTDTGSKANADAYNEAIQSNPEAVEGGSDMPDFLYACGNYSDHHDAGETAHWPTFHASYVSYVRSLPNFQKGPAAWTDKTKKLIAFLFGLSVHYVTDEMWEGLTKDLANGHGFVRFLAAENEMHPGHSDDLESPANDAVDFYLSFASNLTGIKPWERYFPVEDLVNVYHITPTIADPKKNYTDVTLESLKNCRVLFDLGLWAEKLFGQILFPYYSSKIKQLPLVAETVFDLPIGGLDYISVRVQYAWDRIAQWLDVGQPVTPPPRVQNGGDDEDDLYNHRMFQAMKPFAVYAEQLKLVDITSEEIFSYVDERNISKGVYFSADNNKDLSDLAEVLCNVLETVIDIKYGPSHRLQNFPILRQKPKASTPETMSRDELKPLQPQQSILGNGSVGYLGNGIAFGDFDADGRQDRVVSSYGSGVKGVSPQRGSVTIRYGNGTVCEIVGPSKQSRFGYRLKVVDMNLDGVEDLVVSAPIFSFSSTEASPLPYAGEPNYRSWGEIFVYFGALDTGLSRKSLIQFTTNKNFTSLGTILETADVNGDSFPDLLVGNPTAPVGDNVHDIHSILKGSVYVVLASHDLMDRVEATVDISTAAFAVLEGESTYDMFGMSMEVVEQEKVLYVGAPGHRDQNRTVGCIYAYDLRTLKKTNNVPTTTIRGVDSVGEFGFDIETLGSGPYLFVSAPASGEYQEGVVYIIDPRTAGPDSVVGLRQVMSGAIKGSEHFGRFGRKMIATETFLAISAPLSNRMNSAFSLKNREIGMVFLWDNATNIVKGNHTAKSATQIIVGARSGGRLGTEMHFLQKKLPSRRGGMPSFLVVGSPRASTDPFVLNGAVDIYPLD